MNFLLTRWGKGTAGVLLACLLLAWPPAIAYVTAVVLLVYASHQLRLAFHELEADAVVLPTGECPDDALGGHAGFGPPLDEPHLGGGLAVTGRGAGPGGIEAILDTRRPPCSD